MHAEGTPLYIQTLRLYGDDEIFNNDGSNKNGNSILGHYETIQKLITPSPRQSSPGGNQSVGEIETRLEQFVQWDGSVLWRRVVVTAGPSSPQPPTVHASFLLPDDVAAASCMIVDAHVDISIPNLMCWTTFPERPHHHLLCVLASSTLLRIWDVYPQVASDTTQSLQPTSDYASTKILSKEKDNLGSSGDGYFIPLPFEASGIFAVDVPVSLAEIQSSDTNDGLGGNNGLGGLLIQRSETVEDLYAFELPSSSLGVNDVDGLDSNQDDVAINNEFVLKEPPNALRLGRDSAEGTNSLPNLNMSTTTTPSRGDGPTGTLDTKRVPSLFSLSHPNGDILPVSTTFVSEIDGGIASGPVTDVFEKIMFVGTMTWVDPKIGSWLDRKEYFQLVCLTYHVHLKRHAIWLINKTPPPPQRPPIWQICNQWRSDNFAWDSHLGVLQQDLEDMDLVDRVDKERRMLPPTSDVSRYDSRNDALADALGVHQRRATPRNAANGVPEATNGRISRGGHGGVIRSRTSKVASNSSLVSPKSSNMSHQTANVDLSNDINTVMSSVMVGTVGNLYPKISMTCMHCDAISTVPAESVFLITNAAGSGKLCLCLLRSSEKGGKAGGTKDLTLFTLAPTSFTNDDSGETVTFRFEIESENLLRCEAAQPIQSSPIVKALEPHKVHRSIAWNGMSTDLLVLQRNQETDQNVLSLYRNVHCIAQCAIFEEQERCATLVEVINLQYGTGNVVDVLYMDLSNQESRSLRGRLSLVFESSSISEKLLQATEVALEDADLPLLAMKIRADCIRLGRKLYFDPGAMLSTLESRNEAVKTVILALFQLELSTSDVNAVVERSVSKAMGETARNSVQDHERCVHDCEEFWDLCTSQADNESLDSFQMLSKLPSLAIQYLKDSGTRYVAASIFDALHLLYEDMKLSISMRDVGVRFVGSVLTSVCRMAYWNPNVCDKVVTEFLSHYANDHMGHSIWEDNKKMKDDRNSFAIRTLSSFRAPPCILTWIEGVLSNNLRSSLHVDFSAIKLNAACVRTRSIVRILPHLQSPQQVSAVSPRHHDKDLIVAKLIIEEGFAEMSQICEELPAGLSLPLLESLYRLQQKEIHSIVDVPPGVWSLIGRDDLRYNIQPFSSLVELSTTQDLMGIPSTSHARKSANSIDDFTADDGTSQLEALSSMLFPKDNRISEVCRLLRSSRPIYLKVARAIEVSDHDYERKKQEKLLLLSRRVLALPIGRGMLTLGNLKPVPAEPLPVPEICLSGRIPPSNASLALDTSECPADMTVWPEFHNGVAAALRLPLRNEDKESVLKVTRTWIVYNRSTKTRTDPEPSTNSGDNNGHSLNHSHGGLLLGLGLRGLLSALEMTDVFDYLTHGSITTTVGTLLGMAANMRGTCDISVSKMLCLHIPSLIPQHFSTIDVASTVQAAAVAGTGLLYEGSCHRMMTEFLLNEIGRRPSSEGNVVDRESYTLTCGIALGMVLLSKGGADCDTGAGLADLRIEDRLYRYIVGGLDDTETRRRREETDRLSLPSSSNTNNSERHSCVYEGESINTDVTSPGATFALGLMYMKSGNMTIASSIAIPDTHFLLEYVRPDFLMFRVISRALILWDDVRPTAEWIEAQLPQAVVEAYSEMRHMAEKLPRDKASTSSSEKEYDRQAVRLIYTHVIAGACFAVGLRFAGTGNMDAASAIFDRVFELKELREVSSSPAAVLRPPTPVLEMCLGCAAISLSMVLAGTGDLDALRLLKMLRWPCTEDLTYGNHQAYASAIGLLFLGGGTCTLGREPNDIAALLMAFFPRYPLSTSDNQYHLQALRNLYALATKKREIRAIDVETGESVFVPIEIHFENQLVKPLRLSTPCLLLNTDEKPTGLQVVSNKYYRTKIAFDGFSDEKLFFVKRGSAYMSHGQDPLSQKYILVNTEESQHWDTMNVLASFTGDRKILQFAKHLCDFLKIDENARLYGPWTALEFSKTALHECLVQDTQECLPLYVALRNEITVVDSGSSKPIAFAWDYRLIRAFYKREEGREEYSRTIVNPEILAYLLQLLEMVFARDDTADDFQAVYLNTPSNLMLGEKDADEMDLT